MLALRLHMEFAPQECVEATASQLRPQKVEIDDVTTRRGFELVEEILGVPPEASAPRVTS